MGSFILALDQGTTSSRAILFDRTGRIHGSAQQEFPQLFPQPGWVEHDAEAIWQSQYDVARQVLRQYHLKASDIAAIGIANQRETTVIWDRCTGQPIAPAIVWQDRRTAPICEQLRADGHEALFRRKTGLLLDPYFSGTKVKWLLENIPDARNKALRGDLAFGTVDSWLMFKLCGRHVTDVSNASRTLLFDIHTMGWDDELLALLDIPRSMLPEIVTSSGVIADTSAALFGGSIPVAGIAGDQQAATFGQACYAPGMAKNTYGTGCFMLLNIGSDPVASQNNLLTTVGWQLDTSSDSRTHYMLEGGVFMAGATVQWLRDGLGIIEHSSDVEALACSVSDSGGVVFVPAFSGLGAPYWDPYARGAIIGMTRGTSKAHIARAALESIAYQTADLMEAMQGDTRLPLQELRVDGGASRNDLLMQFQADILDTVVTRPSITETTALGAAYLAGLAVSFWPSTDDLSALWQIDRHFEPRMSVDERSHRITTWRRAVQRAQMWEQ